MLEIKFYPESNRLEFTEAAREYEEIWDKDGKRIIESLEKISNLSFFEAKIEIMVYEGRSWTSLDTMTPIRLKLRSSYPLDTKRGTLIHELGHALLIKNGLILKFDIKKAKKYNMDDEQALFLILYDIWIELYGKEFADKQVYIESNRKGIYDYESAWKWALSFSKEKRAELFRKLVGLNK